jgi:hypothetical protein
MDNESQIMTLQAEVAMLKAMVESLVADEGDGFFDEFERQGGASGGGVQVFGVPALFKVITAGGVKRDTDLGWVVMTDSELNSNPHPTVWYTDATEDDDYALAMVWDYVRAVEFSPEESEEPEEP